MSQSPTIIRLTFSKSLQALASRKRFLPLIVGLLLLGCISSVAQQSEPIQSAGSVKLNNSNADVGLDSRQATIWQRAKSPLELDRVDSPAEFQDLGNSGLSGVSSASIVLVNEDPAGIGFNDPTPALPIGGNDGTTLGQQRLNALEFALDKWASSLMSDVTIQVEGRWTELSCTETGAVLGSAGAVNAFRDFSAAPVAERWYPVALASKLEGEDLDPTRADLAANFNVNLGEAGCLTGVPFYLGLDGNAVGSVDFIAVALHELGHGLGFATTTNGQTGALLAGFPSVWDDFLTDNTTNNTWADMSDSERVLSATGQNRLVWNGSNVNVAVPQVLQASGGGFQGADSAGQALIYSPSSFQPGSSVSHWDTSMFPNQLMEPSINSDLTHEVTVPTDLTLALLEDIGWSSAQAPEPVSVTPNSGSGSEQTFSFLFSDANGGADITLTQMLINDRLSAADGCYMYSSGNAVWLRDDGSSAWLGPVTFGAAETLVNSQCTLNAEDSSVSSSGNNRTVNLALSFTAGFVGDQTIYMWVRDAGGLTPGWQNRGAWTVDPCESTISLDSSVPGTWSSSCVSTHRSGSYAQYFTFSVPSTTSVEINLQSSVDTYLFLLSGSGQSGSVIEIDDDGGSGLNSRISRVLSAGTYTIEATTFGSARTGSFTLSLSSS